MTADPNRLGFRVGPEPLRLPSDERGEIPSCDAGCMSYSDGWDHYHTCKFAAWYMERERAVAEVERLRTENEKLVSQSDVLRAMLRKVSNYLETATGIIEDDGGDEEDVLDARRLVGEARALLPPEGQADASHRAEQQPASIPVSEIKRLADLAAQRDEFRQADEATLAVVEAWLAGFSQETP